MNKSYHKTLSITLDSDIFHLLQTKHYKNSMSQTIEEVLKDGLVYRNLISRIQTENKNITFGLVDNKVDIVHVGEFVDFTSALKPFKDELNVLREVTRPLFDEVQFMKKRMDEFYAKYGLEFKEGNKALSGSHEC